MLSLSEGVRLRFVLNLMFSAFVHMLFYVMQELQFLP